MVHPPIRTSEDPLHEAHVRIQKGERQDFTGRLVRARDLTVEVREADESNKVGDGRGFGIWWVEIGKRGPEHVEVATQDRRPPRDGDGLVRLVRRGQPRPLNLSRSLNLSRFVEDENGPRT